MVIVNEEHTPHHRRKRNLTEDDIEALVCALDIRHNSACRFSPTIEPEDLAEAIKFYKHMNEFFSDSRSVIWRTFLALIVVAVAGLVWMGFTTKIK